MNIYTYLDYRKYLKDYYDNQKKENAYFSYRYIARKVSLDPGYLVKVLQGKYHIAQKSIPKFILLCKLDAKESEYFEALINFGKAKTEKQTKLYFEQLLSFKQIKFKRIETYQYEYYQKWYYSAVRSLLGYYPFQGDFKKLASHLSPPISVKEAKEAVTLLERLKLVVKGNDGKYTLSDAVITTGEEWRNIAIRQFQRETIHLAEESLERHAKEFRDISTVTMAISYSDLEEIKDRAKEFRASILKLAEETTAPDCVYQLNLQLVPLTEIKSK